MRAAEKACKFAISADWHITEICGFDDLQPTGPGLHTHTVTSMPHNPLEGNFVRAYSILDSLVVSQCN
jgi:hypothetical protein